MSVRLDKRSGKYVVRWRLNGRHRSRAFTSKRDAERWDHEQKRAKELGVLFEPTRGGETLSEVVELWWAGHVTASLQEHTRDAYRVTWGRHIKPALGELPIQALSPGRVDAFRQALDEAGTGAATIAKALAILSGVCRFAVLRGLIDANPVREVRKPRVRRARFVTPLTPIDVERIRRELLREGRLRDASLVSALGYAGLRPGEALALRWSDVRSASVLIERSAAKGAVKATKNERLRAVRLLLPLAEDFAVWRARSDVAGDSDYVFANRRGGVSGEFDWRNWRRRVFAPAAVAAGVTVGRPYDLRHSFASLLVHEGRSLADVAVQLGDAVATVASTYTHAFVEADALSGCLPRRPLKPLVRRLVYVSCTSSSG